MDDIDDMDGCHWRWSSTRLKAAFATINTPTSSPNMFSSSIRTGQNRLFPRCQNLWFWHGVWRLFGSPYVQGLGRLHLVVSHPLSHATEMKISAQIRQKLRGRNWLRLFHLPYVLIWCLGFWCGPNLAVCWFHGLFQVELEPLVAVFGK